MSVVSRRDSGLKGLRAGRATERQLDEMLAYMEKHPHFACAKFVGKEGKQVLWTKWQSLVNRLNNIPRGATKDVKQWQTVWRDIKFNASKKAGCVRRFGSEDGERLPPLTAFEARALNVLKMYYSHGNEGDTETLIHQPADSPFEVVFVGSEKEAERMSLINDEDSQVSDDVSEEIGNMEDFMTSTQETYSNPQRNQDPCSGNCKNFLSLQEGFLKTQQLLAEAARQQGEAAALQAKTSVLHAENACKQTEVADKITKLLENQTAIEERQMMMLGRLTEIIGKIPQTID